MSADVPESAAAPKDAPAAPAPAPEPAAEAATPQPETTPVAVETVDASKKGQRKIDRVQDKSEMDRADKRTRLDEMDRAILELQTQIGTEKDTGKQARLRDKLAEKVEERKQAYAEYKEMIKSFDAKIVEIETLKGEIDALKAFIKTNESTHDAEKIRELADKTRTLDDKEKALKKLIPGGNLNDVEATLEAYREERKDIRFEEARREKIGEADRVARLEQAEREQADKDLEASLAEIFPEDKGNGGTAEAPAAAKKGEAPLTKEQKEVILDNKIDQIAFDLAKLLATNVPTKDDTFGRYAFEAKRGLLIVLSYFGEDAGWANQLSPEEQKSLAMTVSSKPGADGKTVTSIKWEKLDFSLTKVQKVYELAFGKEGWAKEMEALTPTTKFSELEERVGKFKPDTQDKNELALKKFVETLTGLGAKPESGVQDFITINSDKIIKAYQPENGAAGSDVADKDNESPEFSVDNVVKVVEEKKLHNKTTMAELYNAIDATMFPVDMFSSFDAAIAKLNNGTAEFTKENLTVINDKLSVSSGCSDLLGVPDFSKTAGISVGKALAEMASPAGLTTATKDLVQKDLAIFLTAFKGFIDQPAKDFLEKLKTDNPGENAADIDLVLAALAKNIVPGSAAPAPETSAN